MSARIRELALRFGVEESLTRNVILWFANKPDGLHAIFHTSGTLFLQSRLASELVSDPDFVDSLATIDKVWLQGQLGGTEETVVAGDMSAANA